MKSNVDSVLKRWRENYYFSLLLSSLARPLHRVCSTCERQLQSKVKRNGIAVRLSNGTTLRVARDAGVGIASSLYWHGIAGVEPETSEILRFFLERSSVFLDVGANYGYYSLLASLWNPAVRVIAFEPVPAIYEGLVKNVSLNHLTGQVFCENMALGSSSGTSTLYLPAGEGKDQESTGTLVSNSWQVRQNAKPLQIRVMRLDEYEAKHPMRVDLVKIDVEDFEADVLQGMAAVIRRDQPFIVCEILPRNREHKNERTRQVLQALGYTAYWITPSGYIRVSRFDFERQATNFLLSPVSGPEEVLTDLRPLWELRNVQTRPSVA